MIEKNSQHHRYSARLAFGRRLRHWRLTENRKIAEVAASLGVSTAAWGHWETGERLPSGELLLAIANLTGLPLPVLFCPHLETCPHPGNGHPPAGDRPCCLQGTCLPPPGATD